MQIRQAKPTDIPALCALLQELFRIEKDFVPNAAKQSAALALLLQSSTAAVFVVEADTQVLAMASVQILLSTAEGAWVGLVEDVVVTENQRGKGIGQRLLEHVQSWAAQQGLKRLQLLADKNNAPALGFYQHMGWQKTDLIAYRHLAH